MTPEFSTPGSDAAVGLDADCIGRIVRAGRFLEVQEWIVAGKPLFFPESTKQSVLQIAVEYGFYSMVELLASVWPDQRSLNHALHLAVNKKRSDLIFLLLDHGADLRVSPLASVAMVCDKKLMQFVFDNWEKYGSESGLGLIVTAMPRPLTGLIKQYSSKIPGYERQLTESVLYFIDDFSPLWIGLSLWMGANPLLPVRTPGIGLDEPDERMSPIEYAVCKGHKDAFEQLKPKKRVIDFTQLLQHAPMWRREGMSIAEHLIESGADINDKAVGGSSVLDRLLEPRVELRHTGLEYIFSWGEVLNIERWVKRGARLVLESEPAFSEARRGINIAEVDLAERVLKALRKAASPEVAFKLFNTPRLRTKLSLTPAQLRTFLIVRPREDGRKGVNEKKVDAVPKELLDTAPRPFQQRKPNIVAHKRNNFSRCELHELIWSTPAMRLSKELGMSDVGLAKVCKRYDVPRPGRGYWAKHQVGLRLRQSKLKKPDWNPRITISSQRGTPEISNETRRREAVTKIAAIVNSYPTVCILGDDSPLHPFVGALRNLAVPMVHEDQRLLRVTNTLCQFLENLGWTVDGEFGISSTQFRVQIYESSLKFQVVREGPALTVLILGAPSGTKAKWRDGIRYWVEAQLVDIACWMLYIAAID